MPFALPFARRATALLDHAADVPLEPGAAPVSKTVRAAVEAALDRGETHYTDRPGILPLRRRIAEGLKARFNLEVDAERDMIVTCGATEARFAAIQQLLRPGDVLAAPFQAERVAASALLRRARIASEVGVEAALVYLSSGTDPARLKRLLGDVPPGASILYEVDEAGSTFHPAQLPAFTSRTLTIGGVEADSWRIGFLASAGKASAGLRDFKQALTICSTNLSQWAVLGALEAA